MTTSPLRPFALAGVATLLLAVLPGCFIVLEGDDDDDCSNPNFLTQEACEGAGHQWIEPFANEIPFIYEDGDSTFPFIYEDGDSTYWACGLDEGMGEYWFEFQTVVDDLDGLADIDQVTATVFSAEDEWELDSFRLIDEGGGVYGGLVWESETALYCGDPMDVTFEVWDLMGDSDSFTLYY
jgi:hypothetical protein